MTEYYAAMKKNEIMPLAATLMDLEIIILNKSEREIQIPMISLTCVESKIWHKWTHLQNRNRLTDIENKHSYQRGKVGRDKLGDWDWHIHTTIYKIDNQQGPTV